MEDAVALIDKLINEHKGINEKMQSLEQVANDASVLLGLEEAKDTFVPGRFDQRQSLEKFQGSLEILTEELQAHFNREETALLTAFESDGDRKLVTAVNSLLLEHEDLGTRLAHSRDHVAQLMDGGLARHQWEASAHDMRAHLSHTRKLLEAHAAIENELFVDLRRHLRGEKTERG